MTLNEQIHNAEGDVETADLDLQDALADYQTAESYEDEESESLAGHRNPAELAAENIQDAEGRLQAAEGHLLNLRMEA